MIAIYLRQSVDKKDSISIEGQLDICKKMISDNDEFSVYKDKGFSGKNTDRPEFKKLMKDVENGKIDKIICYKLDRITRSVLDFNNLLLLLKKHKVDFVSATENIDINSPMGRAMSNITSVFAELERENISARIKDNYHERAKSGYFTGGTIPYGFNKGEIVVDGKKVPVLAVNDGQAIVIKKIYDMYSVTSMTLGDISKQLNKEGIKSANGKNWDTGKLSRIMRSSLYVKCDVEVYNYFKSKNVNILNPIEEFNGVYSAFVFGKRDKNERRYTNVDNHYLALTKTEGIIDSTTWLRCQLKLDNNKQLANKGKGKNTWIVNCKCGKCGYSMVTTKNSVGTRYYACKGKYNYNVCEGNKTIRVEDIEYVVQQSIIAMADKLKSVDVTIQNSKANEINKIKMEISKIDEQINNLLEKLLEANDTVMKYINNKVSELDALKSKLEVKLNNLKYTGTTSDDIKSVLDRVSDFDNLDFDSKKDIYNKLISKINVTDEEVEIEWKL